MNCSSYTCIICLDKINSTYENAKYECPHNFHYNCIKKKFNNKFQKKCYICDSKVLKKDKNKIKEFKMNKYIKNISCECNNDVKIVRIITILNYINQNLNWLITNKELRILVFINLRYWKNNLSKNLSVKKNNYINQIMELGYILSNYKNINQIFKIETFLN